MYVDFLMVYFECFGPMIEGCIKGHQQMEFKRINTNLLLEKVVDYKIPMGNYVGAKSIGWSISWRHHFIFLLLITTQSNCLEAGLLTYRLYSGG